jgi:hypothetical protein
MGSLSIVLVCFAGRDSEFPPASKLQKITVRQRACHAQETGGEYLRVTPETYATGLGEILQQLHGRYELGFKPEILDGKRHKLEVELADAVKKQHKGVRLRYRLAYVPIGHSELGQKSWTASVLL